MTIDWDQMVTAEDKAADAAAAQRAAYSRVTMRQARLALLQSSMLHLVEPAIESLPEPERTAAQIEWEYAQTVERNSPLVHLLSAELGLGESQLDELFMLASSL